jgi:methyl-accepting chemotaxis protein
MSTDRQDANFRRRMIFISAFPVIALIFSTIVAVTLLRSVNAGVDRIYLDRVVPLSQLKQIADAYAVKVIDAVNKANAGEYTAAQASGDIDSADQTIRTQWQAYLSTELTAEETRLVDDARQLFEPADLAMKNIRIHLAGIAGSTKGALDEFDGPLYASIDPISNKITELVDLQLRVAGEGREAAWAIYGNAMWILGTIAAISTVVLLGLGMQTYRRMLEPLTVANAMDQVAQDADLRVRVNTAGDMADTFNRLMERFQALVGQVSSGAVELSTSAEEMSAIVRDTASGAHRQYQDSEQVATAINELTASVEEVARNTSAAADSSNEANRFARQGAERVNEVTKTIDQLIGETEQAAASIGELNTHSASISTVLDVIRSIAEQTNLLALNAAIEAARAGEQGRGFAVVADEVRTLAQRTQESTAEIEGMVDKLLRSAEQASSTMSRSQEKVGATAAVVSRAGEALQQITGSSDSVSAMTLQIASMTEEQRSVVEEINQRIVAISDAAHAASGGAEQAATASTQLAQMADQFREHAAAFKT